MACPTCDHAMQGVCSVESVFWCPRCGTIKLRPRDGFRDVEAPALVAHAQELVQSVESGKVYHSASDHPSLANVKDACMIREDVCNSDDTAFERAWKPASGIPDSILTTAQAAKLMAVTPQRVSRLFADGKLRGYRIPGSQEIRIYRKSVEEFIRSGDK